MPEQAPRNNESEAARRLRELNESQIKSGVIRLRNELQTLYEAGIIDRDGNPVRKELPRCMGEALSDVV